jgi:hypothetical protein
MWGDNTTLDLVYMNNVWLIRGNPILYKSATSDTDGNYTAYTVYANEKVVLCGKSKRYTQRDVNVNFKLPIRINSYDICLSTAQAIDDTLIVLHCISKLEYNNSNPDNNVCRVHGFGYSGSTSAGYLGYYLIGTH